MVPVPAGNEAANAPATVNWVRALRLVALASIAGIGLPSLVPGAVVSGALAGMGLLVMPVLAALVVFTYSRSRPPHVLEPGDGGRLGALLGLSMGCLLALVTGITGFVLRYIRHSHSMDEWISKATAQVPAQISAAGPPSADLLGLIQSPEFRAATFILSHVFSLLLLVAVGTLCGWGSASIVRHRRQRSIGRQQ